MKFVATTRVKCWLMLGLILALPFLSAWNMKRHSVPIDQIMGGGPPRDGIPALTAPKFVPGQGVKFVRDEEPVIGVMLNGVAKAYPIRILSWHELVNDVYRDLPVLVSW